MDYMSKTYIWWWRIMKKKFLMIILVCIVFLIIAFAILGGGEPRMKNFPELQRDYETIVNVVQEYYANSDIKEDSIVINITDGQGEYSVLKYEDNDIPLSDDERASLTRICTNSYIKYDYMWVSSDYVIFWDNEMKQYGVLYAKKPRSVMKDIRSWYEDLEYNRLDKNWYEIGYFGI